MRIKESELRTLYIAPSIQITDALGSITRGFSRDRNPVRCSLIPRGGALESLEPGMRVSEKYMAIMPPDAEIAAGDGVCESIDGEPRWLCMEVIPWSAHLSVSLERRMWS